MFPSELSSLLLSVLATISYGLQCYQDFQLLPARDTVVYSKNKTTARPQFELCVIIRKHNGTHQLAQRDVFGFAKLPMECQAYKEHCFSKKNEKEWATVYGCCCNTNQCNGKDDAIDMFRHIAIDPSISNHLFHWLRAILCFFAMITVPTWLTILGTVIYCRLMKALDKEMTYEWDDEVPERKCLLEPGRTIEDSLNSQQEPVVKMIISESKFNDPRLATATSQTEEEDKRRRKKKNPYAEDSTMSDTSHLVDRTQKSDSRRPARSPIRGIQQERPRSKIILPNGGVQKVSMNFDEDEWDD